MQFDRTAGASRVSPRIRVQVVVRWHNRREERVLAEICDVSAEGLFLVPRGPLPDEVGIGDEVWIVVSDQGGEKTLTGAVRWRGFHPSHERIGCGIRLDDSSHDIAKSLFFSRPTASPDDATKKPVV